MRAVIDTIGDPMPHVRVTWNEQGRGERSYAEILSLKSGKPSVPGLGLTPPPAFHECRWRRAVDVALDLWERDGRPATVEYGLGGPEVWRIKHWVGWVPA